MSAEPPKILLVEDNPGDVLLARASLEESEFESFTVIVATRLTAAIARAKSESFDLLVLDLGLPDSSGLETFVRAHAALPDMPIVLLSGLEDEETAMQCVQQGAQDYLLKGFTMIEVLPRAVRYALERHRIQHRLERLASELREKNAELEEELRMAREVQQALLPREYPRFHDRSGSSKSVLHFSHCYRPATTLSGDFFTVLRLSETKAGVLICDVMGHGVRAALIGAMARGLIDPTQPIAAEPGHFLTSLNRGLSSLLRHSGIEAFASAFYLVADLAEHTLRFANAGHPSALVLHRDSGVVESLRVAGPDHLPLGLESATEYPESSVPLNSHDSIVLLTDGLYEEENDLGEQFGQRRLVGALSNRLHEPCDTLLPGLVRLAQQFAGHEEFADDVCLVGIDVEGGASMS